MPAPPPAIDHDLHDTLVVLTRDHGPLDVPELCRRARQSSGRRGVDEAAVRRILDIATLLVPRPDGTIAYLGDVLDGVVLTHRVRGPLADRRDLWVGHGVQPFLAMAEITPLPLATGGEVRAADTVDPVLLGPPGWLPPAEPGDLVALCWSGGRLSVRVVEPDELPGPAEDDDVRRILAERCRTELRREARDDEWLRAALLIQALAVARLENPRLLSSPHAPLDQLLYDSLGPDPRHHWRDVASLRQCESVSFAVTGMPVSLERELSHRARQYEMTLDQFVIALLGHLAWRTPFAEDLGPWDDWLPEEQRAGRVVPLRVAEGPGSGNAG